MTRAQEHRRPHQGRKTKYFYIHEFKNRTASRFSQEQGWGVVGRWRKLSRIHRKTKNREKKIRKVFLVSIETEGMLIAAQDQSFPVRLIQHMHERQQNLSKTQIVRWVWWIGGASSEWMQNTGMHAIQGKTWQTEKVCTCTTLASVHQVWLPMLWRLVNVWWNGVSDRHFTWSSEPLRRSNLLQIYLEQKQHLLYSDISYKTLSVGPTFFETSPFSVLHCVNKL